MRVGSSALVFQGRRAKLTSGVFDGSLQRPSNLVGSAVHAQMTQ